MPLADEILIALIKEELSQRKYLIDLPLQCELIEQKSYNALNKIKEILEDDSFSDVDCFEKIEKIVCAFEALGSGCGNRQDFG